MILATFVCEVMSGVCVCGGGGGLQPAHRQIQGYITEFTELITS